MVLRFAILLTGLSIAVPTQRVGAAEIALRAVIAAPGSIVRLGDVADIADPSEGERQRLAAMPLMPSPPPGQTRYLRVQSIRDLLQAQGESLTLHRFAGPQQVEIGPAGESKASVAVVPARKAPTKPTHASIGFRPRRSAVQTAGGVWSRPLTRTGRHAIEKGLETALEEWVRVEGRAAEQLEWGEVILPDTTFRALQELATTDYELQRDSAGDLTPGTHRFRVLPLLNGSLQELFVDVEFSERQLAVVATAPLRRGELLTAARVELRRLPRGKTAEGAFEQVEEVLGLEASRSLREGEPLTHDNCIGPVLVRRGEAVTVFSGGGGVTVRVQAIARAEGRAGDLVEVEAFDRSERFDARVVGRGRLAVVSAFAAGPNQLLSKSGRER